jgi:serine/threonine protein kinase
VNLLKGKNDGKISLNDFLIIDKLGKGSFGSVYLVRLKNDPTERNYAMKILEKHTVFSQNLLKYAKTERNVLCLANH